MDLVVLFLFQFLTFSESSLLPDLLPDTVLNLTVVLQDVVIPSACCQSSCPTSAPECQTCPPGNMYEKCAKIGALFCEADQKCYTPSRSLVFGGESLCANFSPDSFVGSLPKFEEINNPGTLECLKSSVAFEPYFYYFFEDSFAVSGQCQYLGFSDYSGSLKVQLLSGSYCPRGGIILHFCTLSPI
ncbi:hypothetical protein Anas_04710 [Armadillidium nasatum]|uniref:Uncharacterized protein n=1 Tax=Armadillidium nasatum TaxID=96803 RepID=A0A5N5SM08_9CRUS|nr:hypothetical protein Anas_04710 [Armadillidium nasatum]